MPAFWCLFPLCAVCHGARVFRLRTRCERDARALRSALRLRPRCGRDARAPRKGHTAGCGRDARAPRVAPSTSRGQDARAPRTALDAPLPAGGTPAPPGRQRTCAPGAGGTLALPGRYSMHRCLRAGRPRTQGCTVYVTRAGRPRTQEGIVSVGIWYYSVSRSSIAVASAGSSACANSHPCPYAHDIERRRIS